MNCEGGVWGGRTQKKTFFAAQSGEKGLFMGSGFIR